MIPICKVFTHKFVSPRGIYYHILGKESGTFNLWMWSNIQSGWKETAVCHTYDEAYNLMISIDPSSEWNPERKT